MGKKCGTRIYLPRSTVDYCTVQAVSHVAESRGVSFGKALEKMLTTDGLFDDTLEELSAESEWFHNDVDHFRENL